MPHLLHFDNSLIHTKSSNCCLSELYSHNHTSPWGSYYNHIIIFIIINLVVVILGTEKVLRKAIQADFIMSRVQRHAATAHHFHGR